MNIHHFAYLTKNIERKADELCRLVGAKRLTDPIVDAAQGVRAIFLDLGGATLELVEPHGAESPLADRARKSPGLYHMCFEVDNLEETLESLQAIEAATVVKPPLPAPAFENRRVAFVVTTGNDLVEFLETESREQAQ